MATATDVEGAIRDALDRFSQAYSAKDADGVMKLFAADEDVQIVGTGADEIRRNRDEVRQQVERDFAQSDRLAVVLGEPHVSSVGDVAWALGSCTVEASAGGENVALDARLTAVFERRGGEWLMRQVHLSVPMAGQESGESFPTS
jgi:ketosteroid isomerase-like protein